MKIKIQTMKKELIIEHTLQVLKKLPEDKINEVSNFASFILKKHEEDELTKGIQYINSNSETFDFLNEEEDLYSISDIKIPNND